MFVGAELVLVGAELVLVGAELVLVGAELALVGTELVGVLRSCLWSEFVSVGAEPVAAQ